MKKLTILGILSLAVVGTAGLVTGCDKKPDGTTTGDAGATTSASATPAATTATTGDAGAVTAAAVKADPDEDIADEEDFGSEVNATITETNFESELDKLEKDLK